VRNECDYSFAEEAIPFSIKNSVLNSLPVSADVRHQIWTLATDKPGPLVQVKRFSIQKIHAVFSGLLL